MASGRPFGGRWEGGGRGGGYGGGNFYERGGHGGGIAGAGGGRGFGFGGRSDIFRQLKTITPIIMSLIGYLTLSSRPS